MNGRKSYKGLQRHQCWDEAGRMLSSYREDAFGAWAAWYGYDGNVTQERRTCVVSVVSDL